MPSIHDNNARCQVSELNFDGIIFNDLYKSFTKLLFQDWALIKCSNGERFCKIWAVHFKTWS